MDGNGGRMSRCFGMRVATSNGSVGNFATASISGRAGPATTITSALGIAMCSVCKRRCIVRLPVAIGPHWSTRELAWVGETVPG